MLKTKRLLVYSSTDDRFGAVSKQLFGQSSCDQSKSIGKKKGKKTHEDIWSAIKADTAKLV